MAYGADAGVAAQVSLEAGHDLFFAQRLVAFEALLVDLKKERVFKDVA